MLLFPPSSLLSPNSEFSTTNAFPLLLFSFLYRDHCDVRLWWWADNSKSRNSMANLDPIAHPTPHHRFSILLQYLCFWILRWICLRFAFSRSIRLLSVRCRQVSSQFHRRDRHGLNSFQGVPLFLSAFFLRFVLISEKRKF